MRYKVFLLSFFLVLYYSLFSQTNTVSIKPIEYNGFYKKSFIDTTLTEPLDSTYTSLSYLSAGKLFQNFRLFHLNKNNQFPFKLYYNRNYSNGYFLNSAFANSDFLFDADNIVNKLQIKTTVRITAVKRNEFGGVITDTSLLTTVEPLEIPVFISSAKNDFSNKYFLLDVNYRFIDSANVAPLLGVKLSKSGFNGYYSDENSSGFYDNFYENNFTTSDTLKIDSNLLGGYVGIADKNGKFHFGIAKNSFRYRANDYTYNFNSTIAFFDVSQKFKNFLIQNSFAYVLDEYYQGGIINTTNLNYNDSSFSISVYNSFRKSKVAFFYDTLYSNHFIFNYNFEPQTSNSLQVNAGVHKVKLDYYFTSFYNYVYLDYYALPKQYSNYINWQKITLYYYSKVFRKFSVKVNAGYNYVSNSVLFPKPNFETDLNLLYHFSYFKQKILAQVGFSVDYFSAYYAQAYMPALRKFYLQNNQKVGGYPFMNFELHQKLKRFTLTVRVNNLFDKQFGKTYYVLPNYPFIKRNFQIGLKWDFYN